MPTVSSSTSRCASCGAQASGRFCSSCGATLGAVGTCASCRQPLPAGARFCRQCGTPAGAGSPADGNRLPWLVAGAAALALLGGLVVFLARKEPSSPPPQVGVTPPAAAGAGAMPSAADLAAMSPKERFDRLYNRVMRAAESGDQGTVDQFAPMASMAYAQLDSVDADARYHMAMLLLHTGKAAEAKAVVDTLVRQHPGHLFGYMLSGSIARIGKDDKALAAARKGFLEHYDAEMQKSRPEYGEHQRAVEDFKAAAEGGA